MAKQTLLSVLLSLVALLGQPAWGQTAPKCEASYRIGFFNGIMTTPLDAGLSLLRLQDEFGTVYNNQPLRYARFENPTVTFMDDLEESFRQAQRERPELDGRWELLWLLVMEQNQFSDFIEQPLRAQNPAQDWVTTLAQLLRKVLAKPPTVTVSDLMIEKINVMMDRREKIVGVGHSQGNWFMNTVYHAIQDRQRPGLKTTAFVHAATFTRDLVGRYVNNSRDLVLLTGRAALPFMQEPNVTGGLPRRGDWPIHGFIKTYMNRAESSPNQPYGKLRADIANALDSVAEYPCISIVPLNPSVAVGTSLSLSVLSTAPDGASTPPPPGLEWSSDNPAVAEVTGSGMVTTRAMGVATISVFDPITKLHTATRVQVTGPASLAIRPFWEITGTMTEEYVCRDSQGREHPISKRFSQSGLLTATANPCANMAARTYQYVARTTNALEFVFTHGPTGQDVSVNVPDENQGTVFYGFAPATWNRPVRFADMKQRVDEYLDRMNGRTCWEGRTGVTRSFLVAYDGIELQLVSRDVRYALDVRDLFSAPIYFRDRLQYDAFWLEVYANADIQQRPTLSITTALHINLPYAIAAITLGRQMMENQEPFTCYLDPGVY